MSESPQSLMSYPTELIKKLLLYLDGLEAEDQLKLINASSSGFADKKDPKFKESINRLQNRIRVLNPSQEDRSEIQVSFR